MSVMQRGKQESRWADLGASSSIEGFSPQTTLRSVAA